MNSVITHAAAFILGMHFAMLLWQVREWRRDVRRERREAAQRRFEELDAEVKQRMDAMRHSHDAQVERVERALRTPQ